MYPLENRISKHSSKLRDNPGQIDNGEKELQVSLVVSVVVTIGAEW